MKGVGRIYQQTFIDTYAKVVFAKLYDRKTPITVADLLNDRVVPFYDEHEVKLQRLLTDRGTEYCGSPERHEYELYLAIEDIDHTRTKTKSPQTNAICERFHRTVLDGSAQTTTTGRIRADGATARPRCRPSLTHFPWQRRNSWPQRNTRHTRRLTQPTLIVR